MTLSRRKTLALIGGVTLLAATGATGFAITRTPKDAVAPWAAAGQYTDPRKRALSYAILAPNPHNMQPWIVDLDTPDQATLYVDTDRLLPHTDPFSRQIVIGLGCFLELMALSAAQDGYRVHFDLFPEGTEADRLDRRPVAIARFVPDTSLAEPDLFDQILHRRSVKEPYDTARPVSDEVLATLRKSVRATTGVETTNDTARGAQVRDLTANAFQKEFETPSAYRESVDLFRIGHREVNANPDGLDFSGPMFEAMHLTGLFTREGSLDRAGYSYTSGVQMVQDVARTGMAYIWQVTATNTRNDQIAAGRDWVRLNLAATALGLNVQPMSQALQEYPEMATWYDAMHLQLAPDGGTVQMLGRLGYGPSVGHSPRWPLEAKIRNG